jgi:hypothetical protein
MPQNSQNFVAVNSLGAGVPLKVDADGALIVTAPDLPLPAAPQAHYNITAATVIKATPGTVLRFNVVVAGSTVGSINDCATTGAVAAANEIASLPNTVGPSTLDWPCAVGIVVTPGTGQTIAVLFA